MPETFDGAWDNCDGIECPHCGGVDSDDLDDVSQGLHACAFCGVAMELEIEYSVMYTSRKVAASPHTTPEP